MNLDELKLGVETDRLVAEAIGRNANVRIGLTPSTDLNDAFWAAEEVGKSGVAIHHPAEEECDDNGNEVERRNEIAVQPWDRGARQGGMR